MPAPMTELMTRATRSHFRRPRTSVTQPAISRLFRILLRAQQVKRYIRLVANHPAVVRLRRNVEVRPGRQIVDPAVVERRRGMAREDDAQVLDTAARLACLRSNVR